MEETSRIFLHYFDVHFLQEKVGNNIGANVRNEARLATRLAVLWADEIVVPAASYFESEICRSVVTEHKDLLELGIIILAGNAESLAEFIDKKLLSYPARSRQSINYRSARRIVGTVPFVTRKSSATTDIKNDWLSTLHNDRLGKKLYGSGIAVNPRLEMNWEELPQRLELQAFTPLHAIQLLDVAGQNRVFDHKVANLINASYFSSFTRDWSAGIVDELVYLGAGYDVTSYGNNVPYRLLVRLLRENWMLEKVTAISAVELIAIKKDPQWAKIKLAAEQYTRDKAGYNQYCMETVPKMKVFIVHGHDHKLLYELKDYLQNTLGFEEPIVLMQKPNMGRTIIEKFEDYADIVDAAVVLLTPDDFGGMTGEEASSRARQNVIFELGYFVGKFGRRPGRTLLMTSGQLEIPSDLQGVIYIDVSSGIGSAGEKIRKEFHAIHA